MRYHCFVEHHQPSCAKSLAKHYKHHSRSQEGASACCFIDQSNLLYTEGSYNPLTHRYTLQTRNLCLTSLLSLHVPHHDYWRDKRSHSFHLALFSYTNLHTATRIHDLLVQIILPLSPRLLIQGLSIKTPTYNSYGRKNANQQQRRGLHLLPRGP